jgi:hypothetical protein
MTTVGSWSSIILGTSGNCGVAQASITLLWGRSWGVYTSTPPHCWKAAGGRGQDSRMAGDQQAMDSSG